MSLNAMPTTQEITTKTLHDETGKIVRAARRGQTFRVSIDGEPACTIVPDAAPADAGWDEIMAEVWAAQKEVKVRVPNPVLAERARRRR